MMLQVIFAAAFAALFGLLFCLWGYRLFLVMLPIWGFFSGFWLGGSFSTWLFGSSFLGDATGIIIGLVLGAVFGVLSWLLYIVGVGVVAAGFGAALVTSIFNLAGVNDGILLSLIAASSGIMFALVVLARDYQRYVIIAMTAIGGANLIVLAILLLSGQLPIEAATTGGNAAIPIIRQSAAWAIVWAVIAIGAIIAQLRMNRDYTFDREQYVEGWG